MVLVNFSVLVRFFKFLLLSDDPGGGEALKYLEKNMSLVVQKCEEMILIIKNKYC